jgi:hypothetical protein
MKKFKIIIVLLIVSFTSCENENFTGSNSEDILASSKSLSNPLIEEIEVNNGRLVFQNERDLIQVFEFIDNNDFSIEELNELFQPLFDDNFIPLYPIYTDENQTYEALMLRKDYTPDQIFDQNNIELSDKLITLDEFALFLNFKREVVVNSNLFIYTYSGLYKTPLENESRLNNYLSDNDIYNVAPDPFSLSPGNTIVEQDIEVYVSPNIFIEENSNDCSPNYETSPINHLMYNEQCQTGGSSYGGSNSGGANFNFDDYYLKNSVEYSRNIEPCESDSSWNPFGTSKKCYDYFSSGNRRTKTKYEYIDLSFIQSLTVKVKHQRKHSIWFIEWWAANKAHEVALDINQATFVVNPSSLDYSLANFNIPAPDTSNYMYHIDGYTYSFDPTNFLSYNPVQLPDITPSTPFNEDIIVQVFNNTLNVLPLVDISISVENLNSLYWSQIHGAAKDAFKSVSGYEPSKITTIFHTSDRIFVNYVDISRRRTNERKVNDNLFFEVNAQFKVTVSVDEWNNVLTNPDVLLSDVENQNNPNVVKYGVTKDDLTEFDYIRVDFTGLSRRNGEWRGSKLIQSE